MELVKTGDRFSSVRKKRVEGLAVLVKGGERLVVLVKRGEQDSGVSEKRRMG